MPVRLLGIMNRDKKECDFMVKHENDYDYIRPGKLTRISIWVAPFVIFIGAFSLYIKTMTPSVFWGDSAAFATTNYILGLPHSPSFPLYTLLGRLFSLVPNIEPAFSSNLMSVFFAALSLTLFYLIVRQFIDVPAFHARPELPVQTSDSKGHKHQVEFETMTNPLHSVLPSLAATALFAVSLPVWLSAVRTEVYSFHLFITLAAILFCFEGLKKDKRRLFFLGIWLYALSFTNHPLLALAFAPAFIYLMVRSLSSFGQRIGSVAVALSFFIAAFSVYFYLPLRAAFEPAVNWGRPDDFKSFLAAITRWSDMSNLSAMIAAPDYLLQLKKIGFYLAAQIGWPLIGLLLFGLWGIYKVSKKLFWFFPLAILCNLVIVLWAADFDHRNYDMVNYLAPLIGLILTVSVAGIMYILRMKIASGRVSLYLTVLIGLFIYVGVEKNLAGADLSEVTGPDEICREVLNQLPASSILMVAEDDLLLPMWYRAYVDSTAHEIDILSPGAMVNPAYRKQLMVNYPHVNFPDGFSDDSPGKPAALAADICRLNAADRDIYLQFGVPGIGHNQIVPAGILFRYVGDSSASVFDKGIYKKHLHLAERLLEGNHRETRTVDFTGRWLFSLGVYYQRIGFNDIAWKLFDVALDVDRQSIDLRLHLATALARAKRYKEALKYLADALEIDSQDPDCLRLGQHIIKAIEAQKTVASK